MAGMFVNRLATVPPRDRKKLLGSATKEALTSVLSLRFITTIPDASFTKDFRKWATGTAPTREARNSKGAG